MSRGNANTLRASFWRGLPGRQNSVEFPFGANRPPPRAARGSPVARSRGESGAKAGTRKISGNSRVATRSSLMPFLVTKESTRARSDAAADGRERVLGAAGACGAGLATANFGEFFY